MRGVFGSPEPPPFVFPPRTVWNRKGSNEVCCFLGCGGNSGLAWPATSDLDTDRLVSAWTGETRTTSVSRDIVDNLGGFKRNSGDI